MRVSCRNSRRFRTASDGGSGSRQFSGRLVGCGADFEEPLKILPGEPVVEGPAAGAVDREQQQEEEHQPGELGALAGLGGGDHFRQMDIEESRKEDGKLHEGGGPREQAEQQAEAADEMGEDNVMEQDGGSEPEAAHVVHEMQEIVRVVAEVKGLDDEADAEVHADEVEGEVPVGFDPVIQREGVFHGETFSGCD